jgi:hypothetical protein
VKIIRVELEAQRMATSFLTNGGKSKEEVGSRRLKEILEAPEGRDVYRNRR